MVKDVPSNTTLPQIHVAQERALVMHRWSNILRVSLRGAATWRRCMEPLHVLVPLLSCTLPRSLQLICLLCSLWPSVRRIHFIHLDVTIHPWT